jgi:7,8-dihydroneopterin aldolase/epimerase/oxygenase
MAQLVLENMEFYAHHGHYAEENKIGARFRVDVVIETNTDKAAASDELSDALDYSRVYELVKKEMNQVSRLVEHVTSRIVDAIRSEFGKADHVTVTVSKLNPQVGGSIGRFSVTISR